MTFQPTVKVSTYLGNARLIPFRVMQAGSQGWWDLSTANTVALEIQKSGEVAMTSILCSPAAVGADWSTGLIQAPISAGDVTARAGTYTFALTVTLGDEVITAGTGIIEVSPRPAGLYDPTGANVFYSGDVKAAHNASGTVIAAGTLLSPGPNFTGVYPAFGGGPSYQPAMGIAIATSNGGSMVLYIEEGWLTLADWSAVTGSPTLATASNYYLGAVIGTSQLTLTVPSVAGGWGVSQIVGNSGNTTDTLYLTKNQISPLM